MGRSGKFDERYSYLAFEGGGVKGISYAGAIRALEDAGVLQNIKGVAGSSAGAIAAALVGCGLTGKEVEDELRNQDFEALLAGRQKYPLWRSWCKPAKVSNVFKGLSQLQKNFWLVF